MFPRNRDIYLCMQLQAKDENTLRRYLLGDVSPDERQEIEVWLMSVDEAYDILVAAEDDLIDESLNGKLKKTDLEQFNSFFLAAPERQCKLAFARSSSIPSMPIHANTKLVRMSLTLLDDSYNSDRVLLFDDGGRQLWTASQLKATTTGDGKAVVVSAAGELLTNGDYNFNLSGISNGRPPENISSYYFRVSQ